MDECYDRVRMALSDKTGELRVSSFDIVGIAECSEMAELRAKLVGKRLADINIAEMRGMSDLSNAQCIRVVVNIIAEYQDQFLRGYKRSGRRILQK